MNSRIASIIRNRARRCRELWRGVRNNLKFTNGIQLNALRLFRRDAPEVVYVWKHRFRIACDCKRKEHFGVHEVFLEQCYARPVEQCDFPGNRISYVDIGANVGAFGLWLAARGLQIDAGIAAELNPRTCQRCERNMRGNQLQCVGVVNCGVAGREGWIDFIPSDHALGDSIFPATPSAPVGGRASRVELVTLTTLLRRHGRQRNSFDLLKLDCEGAEYEILRTAPADVLRMFRYIIIEFHPPPFGESLGAAGERLRTTGFAPTGHIGGAMPFIALFVRQG